MSISLENALSVEDLRLPEAVARHIAIIMDGNGRWAAMRGLPRKAGHQQGVEAVRRLVRDIRDVELGYLTLYGFSSENWNRPKAEVNDLMGLLRLYIRRDLDELQTNGVRIRIIGERDNLAPDLVELIEEAENRTKDNDKLVLTIAFNYGGRDEITAAARSLAQAVRHGDMKPAEITSESFAAHLYTADIPDPDLVIRTSGELRMSNFLTWQTAYSELIFIETLWPDFTKQDLLDAISEYHNRERRFGARPEKAASASDSLISTMTRRAK